MSVYFAHNQGGRKMLHMYLKKEAELLEQYRKDIPVLPNDWPEEKKSAYMCEYDRIIRMKVESELENYTYTDEVKIEKHNK